MSLFVVSIPIGNPDDITLRALNTLRDVDFLICEELKTGRGLLKKLDIQKELFSLNEHNETEASDEIIQHLRDGTSFALFSDAGTPVFADPGAHLIQRCHENHIQVIPVPGASSLLAALSVSGLAFKQFYYAGFLSRKSELRVKEIEKLNTFKCPVVIYDTPYRLIALLTDLKKVIGATRSIVLLLSLTKPDEEILRGSVDTILLQLSSDKRKREFVLILDTAVSAKKSKKRVKTRRRKSEWRFKVK